jgi:hypothetical protein
MKSCVCYKQLLKWLIWLDEEVGYVAEQVPNGLELLRHSQSNRIIGFKLGGRLAVVQAV